MKMFTKFLLIGVFSSSLLVLTFAQSSELPQSSMNSTDKPSRSSGQSTNSSEQVKQSSVLPKLSENSTRISATSNQSTEPTKPTSPKTSNQSTEPTKPTSPKTSNQSTEPTKPISPKTSNHSTEPTKPTSPKTSNHSTEPTKPTSPKPPDQTCIDLKSAIWSYDMKSFVKAVNSVYKKLYPHPQTNLGSLEVLNHILVSCHTHTKLDEVVKRPDPIKLNYTQAAGTLDIRTVDQKGGNLVIKLKFNKQSCHSLGQLLKCADEKTFKELYPGEKVTLLSLSFNKDRDGPVIGEWIALYFKDGEIVGKGEQHKAKCLKEKEFNHLKYKEKPIVEYFENLD